MKFQILFIPPPCAKRIIGQIHPLEMRLDIYLKLSRLVPRRTLAQQMCEAGAISVNGARAKSSRDLHVGDELALRQRGRITTVRVLEVPERPPSKAQAASLYETLSVETYEA